MGLFGLTAAKIMKPKSFFSNAVVYTLPENIIAFFEKSKNKKSHGYVKVFISYVFVKNTNFLNTIGFLNIFTKKDRLGSELS